MRCLPFSLTGGKNAPRLVRMRRCRVGAAWAADPGERIETWRTVVGASCWCRRRGCRRRCSSSCAASSSWACWRTGRTWPIRRSPKRVDRPPGERRLHRPGRLRRPAGLPAQRAHGVRVGVRPRRLSRARLHGGLPAPGLRDRQALLRRRPVGLRGAPDDRGPAHQPLRRAHRDAAPDRRRRRWPSGGSSRTTAGSSRIPETDHGLRPEGDHRPDAAAAADRVLRLDRVGGVDEPPRPQLLVHEQLAAGAARRQQADRQRRRLVGAVADRAAGRHRRPVRRLRPLGRAAGVARPRAGDALVPRAGRRRADARAAGHRVVLLRDGGPVPDPDARRRRHRSTTARRSTASSASTWRASSRTT